MALNFYKVENYRGFSEPTGVDLKPLTLLFGYNSAGKSALLRTLPLLAASLDPYASGPLALNSPVVREATFDDVRSRLTKSPFVRFSLGWNDTQYQTRNIELSILDLPSVRRQCIEHLIAKDEKGNLLLDTQWEPQENDLTSDLSRYKTRRKGIRPIELSLDFEGLAPTIRDERKVPDVLLRAITDTRVRLRSLRPSIHWISSLRTPPNRRINYAGAPRKLQPDGKGAADILAYDEIAGGAVLETVSNWYKQATKHRLEIQKEASGPSQTFSVVLSPLDGPPVQIHMADTGEGMSQVFPVVVLVALALNGKLDRTPVLAIEQPELHLHPAVHEELASFFCKLAHQPNAPPTLIETHSENFLLRVQLEIVNGTLPAESVLVYWVRQLPNGQSVAERIEFDELARPKGDKWPPGVFSEDVEQARALVLARRGKNR